MPVIRWAHVTITFYGAEQRASTSTATAIRASTSWELDRHWTRGWFERLRRWRTTNYLLDNSDPLTIGGPTAGAVRPAIPGCARRHPDLPPRLAGGRGERPLRTGRLPAGDGDALTGADERGSARISPRDPGPSTSKEAAGGCWSLPKWTKSRRGCGPSPAWHALGARSPRAITRLRRPLDTAVTAGL